MDCFDTVEAAQFIRNSGVNVQVEFGLTWEGETQFVMRATPWRTSASPNRMVLVGAGTLDEALCMVAEELDKKRWTRLDWRARPDDNGIYTVEGTVPRECDVRDQESNGKRPRKLRDVNNDPHPPNNAA